MKKLDKFVIDREKWARGKPDTAWTTNWMYNPQTDKSCCLGLYAEHCGISKHYLDNKGSPYHVLIALQSNHKKLPEDFKKLTIKNKIHIDNSSLTREKMTVNDDLSISETDRESILKKLFRKIGVSLSFKN